ncbi:MAG: hypothetical protein K2K20_06310 [Lachnospiraceae bacterium]|nr:hypothetical protein [Lachnospiraceae bacterium]
MPLEACLQAAYGFMSEHRAKPASEMEQSGIELSTADMNGASIGRSPRARWSKAESS